MAIPMTGHNYYPSLVDVKNHIARAKRALQLSVVDQENAAKNKLNFHQNQSTSLGPTNVKLKRKLPCSPEPDGKPDESMSKPCCGYTMYQEPWQQKLLTT
jgi:hypothetical protein